MKKADRMVLEMGSGLILVSLAVNALVSYWSLETLRDRARSLEHSRNVLHAIERTFSLWKESETSRRAYLVTGDESTLDAYVAAHPLFEASLDRLAALTGDDPVPQGRIAELRQESPGRLEGTDGRVPPSRQGGAARIERLNRMLREAELRVLKAHSNAYDAALSRAYATLGIGVFLTIALAVCSRLAPGELSLALLGMALAPIREGYRGDPARARPLTLPGQ